MKRPAIILAAVLAVTVVSAGYRSQRTAGHAVSSDRCGNCHADTPPADHTTAFIKTDHGHRARTNRFECTGCHRDQRKECDACHLADNPKWHTEAVGEPAAGIHQRNEHRAAAAKHRSACAECHAQVFQRQCAACHRADETWLVNPTKGER